jgi:hypothetical protein
VTVTANATNFEPKHPLTYQWNSSLGNVSGKGNTATIDTIGAAGGSYTARARITDLKVKNAGAASCTVSFIVKELPKNPPATSWYAATWANTRAYIAASTPVNVEAVPQSLPQAKLSECSFPNQAEPMWNTPTQ